MPKNFGFPRAHRLRTRAEFERVRAEGKAHRGALITLAVVANGGPETRAGFITSKRVGNAVLRNRARRRLREIFRTHQHELAHGVWIVTIASARAARARYAELEHDWLRLAQRASILAP